MRTVVITGGVGGARFIRGLQSHLGEGPIAGGAEQITAIVNVADDMWMNGLRITPDLDSIMYALAGANDEERGWGRRGETERVSAELVAYGLGHSWFTLGDLDLGTHIARTDLLRQGIPLSDVVARLCARWGLGARLLPATDSEVETHVHTTDGEVLHFQEWWVRYRATRPAERFEYRGSDVATPAPGVAQAIREADRVILAPSNPVVSVGAVLAIDGIAQALRETSARVVGISPIIGGRAVRGMADACLATIGVAAEAGSVGLHYGARLAGGLIDAWLIDTVDASALPELQRAGIAASAVPLWMTDLELSCQLAADALRA
ncbi:2-phospho-L-lactate transferase [Leucobacter sp. Z1108]|uniref:2-phospho-L-lactate transferase n=1 Tax=Leucobacter sp. Z1108 TaxID=3439066 RepID=UPI003F31D101